MSFSQRAVVTTASLSNDADVFPSLIGQGFAQAKRPQWATTLKRAYSGREVRAQAYSYPRWEFTFGWEIVRTSSAYLELQTLYGFLGSRLGNQTPFYYQDPDDNAVTAQGFGTGTGAQTVFQLYRTVGSGTIYNYLEPVLVLRNYPSIYVNGTLQTLTTNYTIGNNGVITFVTAPANGAVLTWSGSYLFLCAFDDDNIDPRQEFSAYWSIGKLNFHSIKA
jgi:uncharacterized protein (TIGR02217 family)